MLYLQSAESNL